MKVALVCPYSLDAPGGVQQQVLGLRNGIRSAGHEAWIVAPGRFGQEGVELVGSAVPVRANRSVAPVALHPGSVRRTRRAVQDADVVHVHEPFVPLTSPAVILGSGPPTVGTFHADPSPSIRLLYRAGKPVFRRIAGSLDVVTVVSDQAGAAVNHFGLETTLIPNALDTGAFAVETERNPYLVAFLGRDEPRKGLDVLLEAWPAVRAEVTNAELVVLGASRRAVDESVRFLGVTGGEEKARWLASSAVLCAPNLGGESFGVNIVEGMAAGCAPVVSDLPAFRRVAGSPARYHAVNDPVGLSRRIIAALRDPAGTLARGNAARRRAARFDWQEVLPRYLDLYERVAR